MFPVMAIAVDLLPGGPVLIKMYAFRTVKIPTHYLIVAPYALGYL